MKRTRRDNHWIEENLGRWHPKLGTAVMRQARMMTPTELKLEQERQQIRERVTDFRRFMATN